MKASTEEFLTVLLWAADVMTSPTWRNATSSFESWAYRNGFQQRLDYLARERLVEKRRIAGSEEWIYRLTAPGRLAALGGRDPERFWKRSWDGKWRIILFDLPQHERRLRMQLWRWLRNNGCGYLQNSVWITPDLSKAQQKDWPAKHPDVESFVVMEGRPAHGATDEEVVAGAWDFEAINGRYSRYLVYLQENLELKKMPLDKADRAIAWIREERKLWSAAFRSDPLLPTRLLPSNYLGRKAWEKRRKLWLELADKMRRLKFD